MKIKEILKKYRYFLIGLFVVFILSLLFPYSGDDWQWSIGELSISRIIDFSHNASLNGRYLGNIFVILLTKNKILRGIIVSLTLCLIVHLISNREKVSNCLVWLLILCMPLEIFKQSIVWSSGFANYTISSLFLIISLLLAQKAFKEPKSNKKMMFINLSCYYLSSLFIENMTIFLFLFTTILNVIFIVKNKKLNCNMLLQLVGSVLGALTMFIHPSYLGVLNGNDGYRSIANAEMPLFAKVWDNFSNIIYKFAVFDNVILIILLTVIMFLYFYKNKEKYKNKKIIYSLFSFQFLYIIYDILTQINTDWMPLGNYTLEFKLFSTIAFLIITILLIIIIYSKKARNALVIIGVILGMVAPLCIVSPLGGRNFFSIYILEIILILELYNISEFSQINDISKYFIVVGLLGIIGYYTSIYGYITLVSVRRDAYIEKMKDFENVQEIVVPELPYNRYVWVPDFANDYYGNMYKYIKNVPYNVEFKFIDYKDWKIQYYNK